MYTVTETTILMGSYWAQLIVTKRLGNLISYRFKVPPTYFKNSYEGKKGISLYEKRIINLNESVLLQLHKSMV